MKTILQDNNNYVLRFDKGEDVIAGLRQFMKDQALQACSFSGLGACSLVELGFYNEHLKDYRMKPFLEELEIVSLNGNGSMAAGEPAIHAHGMFSRTDFTTAGGHVSKLVVSVTCEISLTKLEGGMQRKKNDEFNLNLLE